MPPSRRAVGPLVARGVWKRFGGRSPSQASTSAFGGSGRRARRAERIRQDDAAPRRGRALAVDDGTILVAGGPVGSRAARAAAVLVPDKPTGFDELTVTELVSLVHALWGAGEKAAARASVLMAAFGLDQRRDQRLGTLSRGLRRQASAVAGLSLAPPLILVDEATATLDPEAVVVLSEAVAALAARGCGVLLATQDLHFAGSACHEVVLLHRGA